MSYFKCEFCGKDIGMEVEFGGATLLNQDGDFVCNKKCKDKYRKRQDGEMSKICKMTDREFYDYMMPS